MDKRDGDGVVGRQIEKQREQILRRNSELNSQLSQRFSALYSLERQAAQERAGADSKKFREADTRHQQLRGEIKELLAAKERNRERQAELDQFASDRKTAELAREAHKDKAFAKEASQSLSDRLKQRDEELRASKAKQQVAAAKTTLPQRGEMTREANKSFEKDGLEK